MSISTAWLFPFLIKLTVSVGFIVFLVLIAKFLASRVKKNIASSDIEASAYNERLAEIMGDVTYRLIITFAVMVFFQMMGINIGFLITGLTFGIGFAIKQILGNMFAGFMILTNRKFTIGDTVQLEGGLDYFGKILEINIRFTIIQTFDHRKVIIPNIVLVNNFVKTFSTEQAIKTDIEIDLGFQDEPSLVCPQIRDFINSKEFVIEKNLTKVIVSEIRNSGFTIKMFFYMKPIGQKGLLVAKSILKKELLQLYDEKGWYYPWDHIAITADPI